MNHMVIYTAMIEETRKFWDSVLLCENESSKMKHLHYEVGPFIVMFNENKEAERNLLNVIGHIGFEFENRSHIDSEFERI